MAIERTTINGDFDALKAALETLVPAYFASVEKTTESTTTVLTCKDADENTLFKISKPSSGNWIYSIYRTSSNSVGSTAKKIDYFFKVGVNGAFLQLNTAGAVTIAKAANGKTAITFSFITSNNYYRLYFGCLGDDDTFSEPLTVAYSSSPTVGNNCQFVPVPLYGNYQLSNNIPKVFYMPMAQENMRGIVQEITSDSGLYITDGYIAMLYDAGDE